MGPRKTYKVIGYQQITALNAAVGLTIPQATDGVFPNAVLLQPETQNVRFRDDGTDPAAGVGMLLNTGLAPFYYDGDLKRIKFIEATASAKLNVLYVFDSNNT